MTPRTEAGRRLLKHVRELDSDSLTASAYLDIDAAILAIEAEAAAVPRDDDISEARLRGDTMEAVCREWYYRGIREGEAIAAGPRDVPTLPPPDMSLIDTLGEGAEPDRPVRIEQPPYESL